MRCHKPNSIPSLGTPLTSAERISSLLFVVRLGVVHKYNSESLKCINKQCEIGSKERLESDGAPNWTILPCCGICLCFMTELNSSNYQLIINLNYGRVSGGFFNLDRPDMCRERFSMTIYYCVTTALGSYNVFTNYLMRWSAFSDCPEMHFRAKALRGGKVRGCVAARIWI